MAFENNVGTSLNNPECKQQRWLLRTMWEKEKMLVPPFKTNILPFQNKYQILRYFKLSSANSFARTCLHQFMLCGTELALSQTVLDSSKLKEFADDNFKFDEKCGLKFDEYCGEFQFLPFPQCFQDFHMQTRKNKGLFGKELRHILLVSQYKQAQSNIQAYSNPFCLFD